MFVLSYYLCALFFSDALMMNHFIKYSVCTLKSIFKVHPSPRFMYMQQSQALISTAFYWQHRQCETFCITAKAKCPSLCLLIRIFRVGSLRSSPPSQNKWEITVERRLQHKTVMGEEQEDDSSSLKSTGYVFLLSRGLESTTPTQ